MCEWLKDSGEAWPQKHHPVLDDREPEFSYLLDDWKDVMSSYPLATKRDAINRLSQPRHESICGVQDRTIL